ncbi:hypothetical protein BT96DRAFT_1011682 [Gymnopus androsaceus JB14]|uniref:NUDE domain-containing protein n=1 Tax=Gymnopus androsaceus JB14 TaxID=1447944 RepID=A0A6A4IKE9_9AGAR|nr:hypothetical protein BT96DRAFT_1011682 [Gymnopus androsaceus JB14]
MTAVLSPIDALRRDPMSSAMDDSAISYSGSTDWRAKYDEVADMLAETRAELDDFHHASKELEAELEAELQRTEKTQQDLRVKVARAETERDDWKSKFISLQTTHNTITASLQRELDRLRQEHQVVKVQLRELEMGNDDLERTERAVSSTLADVEAKYSRALEEKILLEHELLDKANVEEQCQRLRDELRDSNAEISHLKDQLAARSSASSSSDSSHSSGPLFPRMSAPSTEDLLSTPAPPDLQLAELDPSTDNLPDTNSSEDEATPRKAAPLHKGQSTLLQRAGFQPAHSSSMSTPPSGSSIPRSRTIPSYSSPRTPTSPSKRPAVARNTSTMSTNSTTSTASKSRGVQMVTEMRARVKNLEQKIHTRVPRLRMGSMSGRQNANALAASSLGSPTPPSGSRSVLSRTSWENPLSNRRSSDSKRSTDTESEKSKKGSAGDTSGWVLIMEDSPSPPKERRRGSSPKRTFRPAASTSSSPTFGSSKASPLFQSTINTGNTNIKRPQSRLSGGSTATTTSIPTPTSRPATPTFLPLPTGTTGMIGQKRSTGPVYGNAPPGFTGIRSGSSTPSDGGKALPQIPGAHANITMRSHGAKLPSSNSTNLLGQSRIGRPSGGRRKSAEGSPELKPELTRPRSGSVAAQRKSNS